MRIEKSRHNLVNYVVRHNHAAEVASLALRSIKRTRWKRREIAVLLERVLAFGKLPNDVIHSVAKTTIAIAIHDAADK